MDQIVVPKEPTEEMLEAAGRAYMETNYRPIYAALKAGIAAAPPDKADIPSLEEMRVILSGRAAPPSDPAERRVAQRRTKKINGAYPRRTDRRQNNAAAMPCTDPSCPDERRYGNIHPASAAAPTHNDHPLRHYDRTCPACNAPNSMEYCWPIERGQPERQDPPIWLKSMRARREFGPFTETWTYDANQATKYHSRDIAKSDASEVGFCRVVEHGFITSAAPAKPYVDMSADEFAQAAGIAPASTLPLSAEQIIEHYPHMQHQPDECELCWEMRNQALRAIELERENNTMRDTIIAGNVAWGKAEAKLAKYEQVTMPELKDFDVVVSQLEYGGWHQTADGEIECADQAQAMGAEYLVKLRTFAAAQTVRAESLQAKVDARSNTALMK